MCLFQEFRLYIYVVGWLGCEGSVVLVLVLLVYC